MYKFYFLNWFEIAIILRLIGLKILTPLPHPSNIFKKAGSEWFRRQNFSHDTIEFNGEDELLMIYGTYSIKGISELFIQTKDGD